MSLHSHLGACLRSLAFVASVLCFAGEVRSADAEKVSVSIFGNQVLRVQYGPAIRVSVAAAAPLLAKESDRVVLDFQPFPAIPWQAERGELDAIAAAPWMEHGCALAFTVHDKRQRQFVYYWATVLSREKREWVVSKTELQTPADKVPYEPSSLRNSGGDSIEVQWRIRDPNHAAWPVLLYVNNCPTLAADEDYGTWYRHRSGELREIPRGTVSSDDAE
jgi:hypothetical protein